MSLEEVGNRFKLALRESLELVVRGTFEARSYECCIEKYILDFVGIGGLSQMHEFANGIFERLKQKQIDNSASNGVLGRIYFHYGANSIRLDNGYSHSYTTMTGIIPSKQFLHFDSTPHCTDMALTSSNVKDVSNFKDLRVLVEQAVNILMKGHLCRACQKVCRSDICESCFRCFNPAPCPTCMCQFGTLKNGFHAKCAPKKTKKRKRRRTGN